MRAMIPVFKAWLGACALAVATGALAVLPVDPFSRWTEKPELQGATYLYAGGPGNSAVVLLRYDAGPLRSFDGGVTWTPFTLPGGTNQFFLSPTVARTWYALVSGAMYRTTDGGDTWEFRSPALPPLFAPAGISVSADPNVLYRYVAEFTPCDVCSPPIPKGLTVQVSTDGARTWRDLGPQAAARRAFPSPVEPGLVFVVDGRQVLKSTDQGQTFTALELPTQVYSAFVVPDRTDPAIVYVAERSTVSPASVYSSRDGGLTWNVNQLPSIAEVFVDPDSPGRAFAFAYFHGAYETRDAGRTWVHVEHFFHGGLNEDVDAVVVRGMKRFALNADFQRLTELDLNDGALALASDHWWDPGESGMGFTITHHRTNKTFITWSTYNETGAQVWRVVPDGQWNDRTFSGDIYETTGPPYFGAVFDPGKVVARRVGSAQLRFDNENSALFSYQLLQGGVVNKRIVRQMFGPPVFEPVVYENLSDLWWNAAESGWGIAISHQYDNIFATWLVYDAQGKPQWIVMPDAKVTLAVAPGAMPRAVGNLYVTRGPPSTAPFDPAQVVVTKVGQGSLTFRPAGDALLEYTVDGRTGGTTITRQPF